MQKPDSAGQPPRRAPRFGSAAIGTFATQLTIAVLSFLNVLIVARVLGPAGRGEVTLLMTISMLTATFGLLGLDEANVNFGGRHPELRRALAGNSLLLSAAVGAACIALLGAAMWAFPAVGGDTSSTLRFLALLAIPMLILKILLKFLLQADFRFAVANACWLLPPLLTFMVNVALAIAGLLSVASAFVAWVAAHGLATALLVGYVALRSDGFGRPDAALARRTLGFGGRSYAGRVMMVGNYRLDQWFVGAIAGSRELGLYSIAVAWTEMLFLLPTALVIAQRPYLVRSSKVDAARRAARVFRGSAVLTLAAAAGVILLAPVLCTTIFGADFGGSVADLRLLATGALGILALRLLGNALTAQGRPGLATAGAAAAFAVTLLLDLLLIPSYGGFGAAIASTAAYTVGGVATGALFWRFFGRSGTSLVPRPAEVPGLLRLALRPVLPGRRDAAP